MKKILIILLIVLVILGAIFFVAFLVFRSRPSEEVTIEESVPIEAQKVIQDDAKFSDLPEINYQDRIDFSNVNIKDFNSTSYVFDSDNDIHYFQPPDKFYKYNVNTKKAEIEIQYNFEPEIEQLPHYVYWSPDFNKVLVNYIKDGKRNIVTIDLKTGELSRLNKNIKFANWIDNEKILYMYYNPIDQYSLNVADGDGKNWQKLEIDSFAETLDPDLGYNIVLSPDKKKAIIFPSFSELAESDSLIVDLYTSEAIIIPLEKDQILNVRWSPGSDKIIYESLDDELFNKLSIYDIVNDNYLDLNIHAYVHNMSFLDNDRIIVGVPDIVQIEYSYNWGTEEPIYPEVDSITYALQTIDLKTMELKSLNRLVKGQDNIDPVKIHFDPIGDELYIVSTDKVYVVEN